MSFVLNKRADEFKTFANHPDSIDEFLEIIEGRIDQHSLRFRSFNLPLRSFSLAQIQTSRMSLEMTSTTFP
jgi:hypothetical protein